MSPYIGEIRLFGGTFAPVGWAFCDGAVMAIAENDALFNLIGTTYGGDGQDTFGLPDLRGRVPIHQGAGRFGTTYTMGESAGVETVTLTQPQTPIHNHRLLATTAVGTQVTPGQNLLANSQGPQPYIQENPDAALNAQAVSIDGGGQPHENMQPFLGLNFIISLYGVYPTQS